MSESKSSTVSLDVYSTKFPNCQAIFPHVIVRPLRKFPVNSLHQFSEFIRDLVESGCRIANYVADNLKRATGKNCLNHASNFPCEYCFEKAKKYHYKISPTSTKKEFIKIREKIMNLDEIDESNLDLLMEEINRAEKEFTTKKQTKNVWPASTCNGEPRTQEKIKEIVERIESGEVLSPDEARGIVGRSPLMSLENFDMVRDSSTEYLHSVCLGVSKKLIELTFNVGTNRSRQTKRKLSDPLIFNRLMQDIQVHREFSRRNRELDFAVLKGQDYRNIVLFFFPLVIRCIQKKAKERKLWLLFTFMIRSCTVPQKEFNQILLSDIEKACLQFYRLYEELFGELNCTYNTHVVGSHLIEMRYHGPLTYTSAFCFESFYGEIRKAFIPGTKSTLLQIFKKILLKRILTPHYCQNTIYLSSRNTCLENNSLIYCFKDVTHRIYKICEVRDTYVICYKQGRSEYTFPDLPQYNFSKVGVYKRGLISDEKVKIEKSRIDGKVMEIEDLLITCPINVLLEK